MLSLRLFILKICNFIIKLYLQFRLYLPQYFYCCADFLHRLYSLLRVSLCSRLAFTNILLFDLAQDCPLLDVPCLTAFYKDTGNLYCILGTIKSLIDSMKILLLLLFIYKTFLFCKEVSIPQDKSNFCKFCIDSLEKEQRYK